MWITVGPDRGEAIGVKLTSHAFEVGDGVVHHVLEVLDVAAPPLGLPVALLVNGEHGVASLSKANAGGFHEHAALHGVAWCTEKINYLKILRGSEKYN